jgi:hypothetical protein
MTKYPSARNAAESATTLHTNSADLIRTLRRPAIFAAIGQRRSSERIAAISK